MNGETWDTWKESKWARIRGKPLLEIIPPRWTDHQGEAKKEWNQGKCTPSKNTVCFPGCWNGKEEEGRERLFPQQTVFLSRWGRCKVRWGHRGLMGKLGTGRDSDFWPNCQTPSPTEALALCNSWSETWILTPDLGVNSGTCTDCRSEATAARSWEPVNP